MALTQVKTDGIADDAVTIAKQAAGTDGQVLTWDASGNPKAVGPGSGGQVLMSAGAGTEAVWSDIPNQLTDNSVTLAKMAGGTDGQIITYDASGDPVAVGPGTDGQVLTSTGAGSPPAFEDASGGIPTTGGTFTGDVVFDNGTNAGNDMTWDESDNALEFTDSTKATFGTGGDMSIYHNGSNSNIDHNASAAGDLFIRNRSTTGSGNVYIESGNGVNGESENAIVCQGNSKVKLYCSGTERLRTTAYGVSFSGSDDDAESLDDYEEGYFTFTMDSESGDAWTSRGGYTKMRYVKVGTMVTFSGKYETNSSGGTPSGRLQITNLPFASIAATGDASNSRAFHGYIRGMSSDDRMVMHLWWMGANSTTLLAHSFSNDNNGDMQSFATGQLNSLTVWEGDVTGTYFTA